MIKSRRSQLGIALIVACTCGLALCTEPNEVKTDVEFVIENNKSMPWLSTGKDHGPGRGPIKPTHVAIFHVRRPNYDLPTDYGGLLRMLKTPAGKSLSDQQHQFLNVSDAIAWLGVRGIKNHDTVYLYAVDANNAKKMVQAFIEVGISAIRSRIQECETELSKRQERIAKVGKELPPKEAELESVTVEYEIVKKKTHGFSSDPEAAKESKETILEMNRMLDSLAIEITGIEAKLSAVERIKLQRKVSSAEGLAKLEEIRSEQTVELAGALARKKAAIDIREREEEFYGLYQQASSLANQVKDLKRDLSRAKNDRQRLEKELANPEPYMQLPKLYQGKVVIYPVETR